MAVTQTAADDAQSQTADAHIVATHIETLEGLSAEARDISQPDEAPVMRVRAEAEDEALPVRSIRRKFGWNVGSVQPSGTVYLQPMH